VGGFLSGFIPVIGNQHLFCSMAFESLPVVFRESVHSVACRHVPVIGAPEGKGINQRFTENDLFRDCQRLFIPDTFVRPGKVRMQRRALAQPFRDLPTVHFRDCSSEINHRDYNRAGEVLVAAFSQDAESLQSSPDLRAFLAVAFRQSVAKRSIRKTQPEVFDHFRMLQASALQIPQSFGALLQGLVIISNYAVQRRLVVDSGLKRRLEFYRRGGPPAANNRTRRG
jgi:hypothetical protein